MRLLAFGSVTVHASSTISEVRYIGGTCAQPRYGDRPEQSRAEQTTGIETSYNCRKSDIASQRFVSQEEIVTSQAIMEMPGSPLGKNSG